jgi:hypothetical protein
MLLFQKGLNFRNWTSSLRVRKDLTFLLFTLQLYIDTVSKSKTYVLMCPKRAFGCYFTAQ